MKNIFLSIKLFLLSLLFFIHTIIGYNLPYVGLGLNNFLNGGPLRPRAGWYYSQYFYYYTTHTFLDSQGKLLNNVPSPALNSFAGISEIIYQTKWKLLWNGMIGFEAAMPYAFYSHIEKNLLGITDSGKGFGDLYLSTYIQWNPIFHGERPIFQQRLSFNATFPTGKVQGNENTISPGNNIFYITPCWSATLFFTPKFTLSWRLTYLWCATNPATHKKPGDAIYLEYNSLYECRKNLFIGINSYYLKQLKNTKLDGQDVPDSKEQVFAAGPGLLYEYSKTFYFIAHFYKESKVINRTKGTGLVVRFLKIF